MPGWDLVLRPIKDVSVLYALGDDRSRRAAREANWVGVAAAVAYLDGQVGTRRGRGGAEHVGGEGLLAVGFTHRTSRAGDPLLHTHLVIVNRTLGPDGQWRTLDSRDLLAHRQATDAIYRAAYQTELSRTLGIRWGEPDRWGNRAIEGMPEGLVRAFSKRHEQITAELERLEREDGRLRTGWLVQYVAHATRPPKTHDTPETLYERWQQEARELGIDLERLVGQVTGRHERHPALDGRTVGRVFDQLAGPDGLTEHASTFARHDVVVALGAHLAAVPPEELGRLAERFLTERAISVMAEHAAGERRYTTPELLKVEERLLAAATGCAGEQTATCSHAAVREALRAHATIAAEQTAMVRDITQGGAGVAVVDGRPGTGKTFTLGVARHAWQLDGYRVLGTAPPGSRPCALAPKASRTSPPATSCSGSWTPPPPATEAMAGPMATGRCWTPGRCWWWTRPACSAAASSPASSTTRNEPGRRSSWWAMTGSLPPSRPAAASAAYGCG
jgi:conjugative relaxase-like TrwC/TraI family protein